MDYDSNVYYHPEASGLAIVGEVEFSGGYEFDKSVVWQGGGVFLYAEDSGCSCPTPFGSDTRETLRELHSLAELRELLTAKNSRRYYSDRRDDIESVLSRAREAGLR